MSFRLLTDSDYIKYFILINEFRKTNFTEEMFINTLYLISKNSEIWVYEKDEELLATGTIIYEHKFLSNICIYAHIEDICVKASHRRQGLGKLLVKHLIERARHCYKITLVCADNNILFYEACGLERRGNQMCQLLSNLQ